MIFDHLPVLVNLKLHHPTQQKFEPKFRCMKHFDPNTFLTDLSHNLNNLNPEAGEVTHSAINLLSLKTLLISMHHTVTHPETKNAPLTNHGSPKAL